MSAISNNLRLDLQGNLAHWLLAFMCIVFASTCLYIAYLGMIKWPNGDEGIYLSGGYQLTIGNKPHVDFWWPQGIGINFIVAFWGNLFGFNLLSMRFFSLCSLVLSIIISGWVLWRYIHVDNRSLSFTSLALCGLSCQAILIYFGGSLGTKEGILCLLLIFTAGSYIRYFEEDTIPTLFTFGLSVSMLVLFKPNLIFATSFFIFHSICFKKSKLTIFNTVCTIGIFIFIVHYCVLGDFENFHKLIRDLSNTAKDIHLMGYKFEDALYLAGNSAYAIALSVLFIVVAVKNVSFGAGSHPGSILLGYWLCNIFFNLLIFYPSLLPVYFYQFNLLLLLGLLLYVGRMRWSATPLTLIVMTTLAFANFYTQISDRVNNTSFADATGYFKSPTIVERLNRLPYNDEGYLFIGRHMHLSLESNQKQSVYSVGGTVNMDLLKPDKNTANEMRVIATSNILDLLKKHRIIVLQNTAKTKFAEIDLISLLYDESFELLICDELACLFSKTLSVN